MGGSDAAAILGLNPWKSAFQLYLEKTGEAEQTEAGEAAYWGNVLEEIVAQEFSKRTGIKVHRVNRILHHPEHPWMLANIDRKVTGKYAFLECKTTSAFNAKEWRGQEIPAQYIAQVFHYLAVTGATHAYLAVLIGGQRFTWKRVDRDEETIAALIQKEAEFWEKVKSRTPPPIDGSKAAESFLAAHFPSTETESCALPREAETLVEEWQEFRARAKEFEDQARERENKLKLMLGKAESGVASHFLVKWKNVVSTRLDTKKLKTERPDVFAEFSTEINSRRFGVTEMEGI